MVHCLIVLLFRSRISAIESHKHKLFLNNKKFSTFDLTYFKEMNVCNCESAALERNESDMSYGVLYIK